MHRHRSLKPNEFLDTNSHTWKHICTYIYIHKHIYTSAHTHAHRSSLPRLMVRVHNGKHDPLAILNEYIILLFLLCGQPIINHICIWEQSASKPHSGILTYPFSFRFSLPPRWVRIIFWDSGGQKKSSGHSHRDKWVSADHTFAYYNIHALNNLPALPWGHRLQRVQMPWL